MLELKFTNKMKRDVKRMVKRGKDISKLEMVLDLLINETSLEEKYKDHQLKGKEKDFRECHIEPDWLLKYQIRAKELVLVAVETGTHADLFEM